MRGREAHSKQRVQELPPPKYCWREASCAAHLTATRQHFQLVTAPSHKSSFECYTSESIDRETTFGKSRRFHISATQDWSPVARHATTRLEEGLWKNRSVSSSAPLSDDVGL